MALPSPFSKGTFLFDLTDNRQKLALVRLLRKRGVLHSPFNRAWDVLCNEGCENGKICRTVILEAEYVDRDYAEGYGQLYGRAFRDFERKCYRLHFFSETLQVHDFRISSLISEEGRNALRKIEECYLGFSVMRPSCPDTIGRTVILPPKSLERTHFACECFF